MAKILQLDALGEALDQISLQWLNDNYPELAEALDRQVERGAAPDQVRRYVVAHTGRLELALRMEQAARALATTED